MKKPTLCYLPPLNKVTQGLRVLRDFHTMADGLYFHRFRDLLLGCGQHRLTTDFGLKQCVHQSRLSQAALSCKQKHTWVTQTARTGYKPEIVTSE